MNTPYHEYAKGYPKAIASIAACLADSHLAKLEAIALRFAHALEENTLDLKQGNEREFLCDILVQATNEMFAMIGCLRNGALLPSYHHTRSVLELYASLEHVYCAPAKRERKLEKFVEYPNVSKYLHSHSWQQQLSKGEITNDQFIQGCAISQNEFNDLKKRLTKWQRIWKLKDADPDIVKNWHYPATIRGLFESTAMTNDFWTTYEIVSHATHLSPLGRRLRGGQYLIGFPADSSGYDYKMINWPIVYSILASQAIVSCLHETVRAGLIEGVLVYKPNDLRSD